MCAQDGRGLLFPDIYLPERWPDASHVFHCGLSAANSPCLNGHGAHMCSGLGDLTWQLLMRLAARTARQSRRRRLNNSRHRQSGFQDVSSPDSTATRRLLYHAERSNGAYQAARPCPLSDSGSHLHLRQIGCLKFREGLSIFVAESDRSDSTDKLALALNR
jgi:hypothetical protein